LLSSSTTNIIQPELYYQHLERMLLRPNPNGIGSGIGSVINKTGNTYPASASNGKRGKQQLITVVSGITGGRYRKNKRPNDIDFVYPTRSCPLNGKTNGAFKIGSNEAVIQPDPKPGMLNNASISFYHAYWSQRRVNANKSWLRGWPP
jgi:hypothetical protein